MMPWASIAVAAVLALAGLPSVGCSYDPKFKDNQLKCSVNSECPNGHQCIASFCNRVGGGVAGTGGMTGTGGSSPVQDGGVGGDAISPAVVARFVGNWTLSPTSSVHTTCDDGFNGTTLLSPVAMPSTMKIAAGIPGVSDLESSWLCSLSLRLDTTGAHLFDSSPTCSSTAGTEPAQTWTASAFDITGNNGSTAAHAASYTRVDRYLNGNVVTCMQAVTAQLVKAP